MHIGLVIYGSLDSVSGGYLYDRQLVSHLQAQGDTVEVVSLPWRSYGQHLLDNRSARLRSQLQYGHYDIVLQDELNHPSLFRLNLDLRHQSAPTVSIVHHLRSSEMRPTWQNAIYRRVEQQYLNTVDAFVFNSRTTAAVVEALRKRPAPSVVAYPGRDHLAPHITPDMVEIRAHDYPLCILFVGNVIRRKGLHVLIAALGQLATDLWALEIVGDESIDPAYTAEIADLIQRLPPGAQVQRFGRLDDAALAERFAAAHVLAVPSTYEGFGIVYGEGFGYGLPAIATTSGAASEIIEDSRSGFLVAPENVDQMAQCLYQLAMDRVLLSDMSSRALERFTELPTWAATTVRIREFLLEQIVPKAGQP